jgi:hypothetical protein
MRPTTALHDNVFDFDHLLHPGTKFEHPRDVVSHSGLTLAEKRAILASWASDASAIASCPSLRVARRSSRRLRAASYRSVISLWYEICAEQCNAGRATTRKTPVRAFGIGLPPRTVPKLTRLGYWRKQTARACRRSRLGAEPEIG